MARLAAFLLSLSASAFVLIGCTSPDDSVANEDDALGSSKLAACVQTLSCDAPAFAAPSTRAWRHALRSMTITALGGPKHRGRDLVLAPDANQTILAKFSYGPTHKDLTDEEVDVFVQRDCASGWEKIGTTVTTTNSTGHSAVEGVEDDGGRVYFEVPSNKRLGPGLHRLRLVVAGDGTSTDLLVDVLPPDAPVFVSDVDGTLTGSEMEEFGDAVTGDIPETHDGAAEAFRVLVSKGYHPIYLTARPDWLTGRTREFLAKRGFPLGVVHTSLTTTGAGFGSAAARFKSDELADLAKRGIKPRWAFGNKPSDSDAYASSVEKPNQRVFFQIDGAFVGRRIDSYTELLPEFSALPMACK